MPKTLHIRESLSKITTVAAVAAYLLDAAPARATFTFNVKQVSLSAGAADLFEATFAKTGSSIAAGAPVSENQRFTNSGARHVTNAIDTHGIVVGVSLSHPDRVAVAFGLPLNRKAPYISSDPHNGHSAGDYQSFAAEMLSSDLAKTSARANDMPIEFAASTSFDDNGTLGIDTDNSTESMFRSPSVPELGAGLLLLILFGAFGTLLTHIVMYGFRGLIAVKVSSQSLDAVSKRETKHAMDRFRL